MIQFETKALPFWKNIPLYLQVAIALVIAAGLGASWNGYNHPFL